MIKTVTVSMNTALEDNKNAYKQLETVCFVTMHICDGQTDRQTYGWTYIISTAKTVCIA